MIVSNNNNWYTSLNFNIYVRRNRFQNNNIIHQLKFSLVSRLSLSSVSHYIEWGTNFLNRVFPTIRISKYDKLYLHTQNIDSSI